MSLSDKILDVNIIFADDVREAIKELKDNVILLMGSYNVTKHEEEILDSVNMVINEIFGDKLVKGESADE